MLISLIPTAVNNLCEDGVIFQALHRGDFRSVSRIFPLGGGFGTKVEERLAARAHRLVEYKEIKVIVLEKKIEVSLHQ